MSVLGLLTHYSVWAVGWVTWEIRFSKEQILLSPLFRDRIWSSLGVVLSGLRERFPGGKLPQREADLSRPSNSDVWSDIFTISLF